MTTPKGRDLERPPPRCAPLGSNTASERRTGRLARPILRSAAFLLLVGCPSRGESDPKVPETPTGGTIPEGPGMEQANRQERMGRCVDLFVASDRASTRAQLRSELLSECPRSSLANTLAGYSLLEEGAEREALTRFEYALELNSEWDPNLQQTVSTLTGLLKQWRDFSETSPNVERPPVGPLVEGAHILVAEAPSSEVPMQQVMAIPGPA